MKIPKVILRIETSRACGRGILLGISKYCNTLSRWRLTQKMPFYIHSTDSADDPNLPENWLADGMVVARPDIPELVRQIGVPIVGIDVLEPISGMPNIVGDNDTIASMALKHFMDRGFSNLAYCQFSGVHWAAERGDCFSKYAKAEKLEVSTYNISSAEERTSWEDQLYALGEWLQGQPWPLAVFACNDDCARVVSAACEYEGIRVPDDVAILGADNDEMVCLPCDPPISSISLDFEKAGFDAAVLLDRIMKGEEALASQDIILRPGYVVERQSTDILAIDDKHIAAALRYIRDHAHESIGVPDVVQNSGLSRRGLEYRFKETLGRSINSVIKDHRAEKVSKLLIQTNLTVSQIAYELGFTDIEHISRYFRREKGLSPTEFRKLYGVLL